MHRSRAQFVEREPQAGERAHAGEKSDLVDRLGQEVVGARLEASQPVGGLIESRHHDDGDMPRRRIGFQPAADLESVHPRHHHVEQNDVAIAGGADLQGVRAVGAGDDVEIIGGEARLQKF